MTSTSSSFLNNCLSVSVIESLEECKLSGKFLKKSLNSFFFTNWKNRHFKLFLSNEYKKYDTSFKNIDFKIIVYYSDQCITDRKGILVINEKYFNLQLFDKTNGFYSIAMDVYKLSEDGRIPSKTSKLYIKSESIDDIYNWSNKICDKNNYLVTMNNHKSLSSTIYQGNITIPIKDGKQREFYGCRKSKIIDDENRLFPTSCCQANTHFSKLFCYICDAKDCQLFYWNKVYGSDQSFWPDAACGCCANPCACLGKSGFYNLVRVGGTSGSLGPNNDNNNNLKAMFKLSPSDVKIIVTEARKKHSHTLYPSYCCQGNTHHAKMFCMACYDHNCKVFDWSTSFGYDKLKWPDGSCETCGNTCGLSGTNNNNNNNNNLPKSLPKNLKAKFKVSSDEIKGIVAAGRLRYVGAKYYSYCCQANPHQSNFCLTCFSVTNPNNYCEVFDWSTSFGYDKLKWPDAACEVCGNTCGLSGINDYNNDH